MRILKSFMLLLAVCMLSACAKDEQEPKTPVYNTTVLEMNVTFTEPTLEYLDAVIEFKGFGKSVQEEAPQEHKWKGLSHVKASNTPASSACQIKFKLKDGLTVPVNIPDVSYSWDYTCVSTSTEGTIIGNLEAKKGEVHSFTTELKTELAVEKYLESLSKGFSFTVGEDGKITVKGM